MIKKLKLILFTIPVLISCIPENIELLTPEDGSVNTGVRSEFGWKRRRLLSADNNRSGRIYK